MRIIKTSADFLGEYYVHDLDNNRFLTTNGEYSTRLNHTADKCTYFPSKWVAEVAMAAGKARDEAEKEVKATKPRIESGSRGWYIIRSKGYLYGYLTNITVNDRPQWKTQQELGIPRSMAYFPTKAMPTACARDEKEVIELRMEITSLRQQRQTIADLHSTIRDYELKEASQKELISKLRQLINDINTLTLKEL